MCAVEETEGDVASSRAGAASSTSRRALTASKREAATATTVSVHAIARDGGAQATPSATQATSTRRRRASSRERGIIARIVSRGARGATFGRASSPEAEQRQWDAPRAGTYSTMIDTFWLQSPSPARVVGR